MTLAESTDPNPESSGVFPALSPGILIAPTPDGGVVYDLVIEALSFLNPTGAALCHACASQRGFDEQLAEWSTAAHLPVEQIRTDVDDALAAFRGAGFIGRNAPTPKRYLPDAPVTPAVEAEFTTTQAAGVHRIGFRSVDAVLIDAVADRLGLASNDPPTAEFHVLAEPDGSVRLLTDTEWHFGGRDDLIRRLVMVINDFVARTTTDVVLHAAALGAPDGATVVFPAAPGSGKSTLAGVLIQRGWDYLADESATIRSADLAVVPCAKPLGLDAASCVALGLDAEAEGDVAAECIAPDVTRVRDPVPSPAAIVIPSFVGPDGTSSVTTLEFDDALVALVAGTLNLRYVGTPGLVDLAALAASVPVHQIAYRTSAEAVAQLTELGFDSR